MNIDLTNHAIRQQIADTIGMDIDDWCEANYADDKRKHLGASQIGKPCSRALWYQFRWAGNPLEVSSANKTTGQVLRLFLRGHREEPAIIEYLEGIGCKFDATPETQIKISDVGGHFGGSCDNVGTLPTKFGYNEKVLFEFKTSNFSDFNKLKREGVKNLKPVHFSQMCVYGFKLGLQFALYICVDKNSDDLYVELIELDWEHAKTMLEKASHIIQSPTPTTKISSSITNWACKWCSFQKICHYGEPLDVNCRTCQNSIPVNEGKWACKLAPANQNIIPEEIIKIGCPSYKAIQ